MNLLERFKAWATSWWYVPTIEARQIAMLREVWRIYRRGTVSSFHFKGAGVSVTNACSIVTITVPTGNGGEGGNWSASSGTGGRGGGGGPNDGKTHQIDFSKGKFTW